MRQADADHERASDETARGVQVVHDTHKSFGVADEFNRAAVERPIVAIQPFARAAFLADDGVEGAKQANEQ